MRRSKPELWVMYLETFFSSLGKCPYCVLLLRSILKLPLTSLSFLSCLRSIPIQFILHSTLKIQPVLNPQPTLSLSNSLHTGFLDSTFALHSWQPYNSQSISPPDSAQSSRGPHFIYCRAKPSSVLWSALFTLTSLWDALLFLFCFLHS